KKIQTKQASQKLKGRYKVGHEIPDFANKILSKTEFAQLKQANKEMKALGEDLKAMSFVPALHWRRNSVVGSKSFGVVESVEIMAKAAFTYERINKKSGEVEEVPVPPAKAVKLGIISNERDLGWSLLGRLHYSELGQQVVNN